MKMPKLRKLSNKALIESALDNLQKDSKLHFYNIEFGNWSFVFDLGKNSICHFKIKEIPGFIFAIWTKSCFNSEQFNSSESEQLNCSLLNLALIVNNLIVLIQMN